MNQADTYLIKSIFRATILTLFYAMLGYSLHIVGPTIPFNSQIIMILIVGFFLNHFLEKKMFFLIQFNEVRKAMIYNEVEYLKPLSQKEYVLNTVAFYPISAGLVAMMLMGNPLVLAISILFIWFINLIGETSKYRLNLYISVIQKVALKESTEPKS